MIGFTPPQVAERLQIGPDKVLAWIRSGELRAVNVASSMNGKRPRWRVDSRDLDAFLSRRAATPTPTTTRRQKRSPAHVIQFF